MTEEEAMGKECRVGGPIPAITARDDSSLWWPRCSANGCAHWAWERLLEGVSGYCGLKSAPE